LKIGNASSDSLKKSAERAPNAPPASAVKTTYKGFLGTFIKNLKLSKESNPKLYFSSSSRLGSPLSFFLIFSPIYINKLQNKHKPPIKTPFTTIHAIL